MKLTKRILCLVLAMAMLFALSACGKKDADKGGDNAVTTTTTAADDWGDDVFNDAELDWG